MAVRRARRRPGENLQRLREAGLIEFGLLGFSGASTAAIARRAEVPQPHVYAHFATKGALFLACCAYAVERLANDGYEPPHSGIGSPSTTPDHVAPPTVTPELCMIQQAFAALGIAELAEPVSAHLDVLQRQLGTKRMQALFGEVAVQRLAQVSPRDAPAASPPGSWPTEAS